MSSSVEGLLEIEGVPNIERPSLKLHTYTIDADVAPLWGGVSLFIPSPILL